MLMDHIVDCFAQMHPSHLCLAFSFQRSYGELKSSALGMYRSLLHQLLSKNLPLLSLSMEKTTFQQRCRTEGQPGTKWAWMISDLRAAFTLCLEQYARDSPAVLFLDALDEAGQDATEIFSALQKILNLSNMRLSMCFSSRLMPFVSIEYDFAISVELANGEDVMLMADQSFARHGCRMAMISEAVKSIVIDKC